MEIAPSYVAGALLRGGQRRRDLSRRGTSCRKVPCQKHSEASCAAAQKSVVLYDAALVICRRSTAPWRKATARPIPASSESRIHICVENPRIPTLGIGGYFCENSNDFPFLKIFRNFAVAICGCLCDNIFLGIILTEYEN